MRPPANHDMINSPTANRIKGSTEIQGKARVTPDSKALRLRPGQILSGKIVQTKADGWVLISSGNKSFEAHTSLSLREGAKYQFLVRSTGPQIELKVLESRDPFPSSTLKVWDSGQEMRRAFSAILRDLAEGPLPADLSKANSRTLRQIHRLLPLLVYQGPTQDDALMLPQKLLASGVFWESKVLRHLLMSEDGKTLETLRTDDLKGLLLKLKEELQPRCDASRELRATIEQVDRLLSIVQNHQNLNLSAIREGWGWYWFIPGADEREFLHGEVFEKKSDEGESHHIQMNLSFTRLGEIGVSCLLRDNDVSVDIRVTDSQVASFLEENLSFLEDGLKQKGLKIGRLTCELIPEGPPYVLFSKGVGPASTVDVVI